ncbi:MAG: MerR family transcriptional regulator [Myxococcales bacterium]|nr:MerR family transcriptional regulator [Myxococcales bacterium]
MFRIGEFSRLAQVSCRLLRHYDALGLLRPRHVDDATGYRYYDAAQLTQLARILVLRDLGFSLEQIASLVDEAPSVDDLRAMLSLRRAELASEVAAQSARLEAVARRIADLDHGALDGGEVVVRHEPERWFASMRASFADFDAARAQVQAILRDATTTRARVGRLIVVQRMDEFEPAELDLEIGFEIDAPPNAPPPRELSIAEHRLGVTRLAALERVAVIVRVGPIEAAHRETARIARTIEPLGYTLDGPNREVFLRNPSKTAPPVVEMQYPVRLRSA